MKRLRIPNNRGQNLLEFALVIPLLVLLLLIIIDLGRIAYTYSALHNAVREGARYGVIDPNDTAGIEARTRQYAIGLKQEDLTVTPLYNGMAETIEVTAEYDFKTASPILRLLLNTDVFTLESVSLMNTEE